MIFRIFEARLWPNYLVNPNFFTLNTLYTSQKYSIHTSLLRSLPPVCSTSKNITWWIPLCYPPFALTSLVSWQWWNGPSHPTSRDLVAFHQFGFVPLIQSFLSSFYLVLILDCLPCLLVTSEAFIIIPHRRVLCMTLKTCPLLTTLQFYSLLWKKLLWNNC